VLTRDCQHCGRAFRIWPFEVNNPRRRFCSHVCSAKATSPTHGLSRTRLHVIWCGMKTRCYCRNHPAYAFYGSRGVVVCDEWRTNFVAFYDWALANGYRADLVLDRRNTHGNYEPDNCRWVTRCQQSSNTRKRSKPTTSRFKGVSWCANAAKWRVQIQHQGAHKHVGLFHDELQAAQAYDAEALQLFGDHAHLNFPKPEGVEPF
jgi:hypothetical protein